VKTVESYAVRSLLTRLNTISGQEARVSVLVTAASRKVYIMAVYVTMYSKGVGNIEGLIVSVAPIHGPTIVTLKVFDLPESTPSGVEAFVTTV